MSLNLNKLEKVRHLANGGVEARCPACAEGGHDRKGEHLLIKPDGRFGCCANPKDSDHRKRIFALVGDSSPRSIKVKVAGVRVAAPAVMSGVLGRLGRVFATPAKTATTSDASDGVIEVQPEAEEVSGVLGRLGRGKRSPSRVGGISDASDGVNEVQPESAEVRTLRTGSVNSIQDGQRESRTLRTPQYPYTLREKGEEDDLFIEIQGVPVGASEASELVEPVPLPTGLKQGVRSVQEGGAAVEPPLELVQGVRSVRMPYLTPGGVLGIPIESPERFHWWKGGQSLEQTRAEVEQWIREAAGKEINGAGV